MINKIKDEAAGLWEIGLDNKPDFDMAMKRIYAWYEGEILDRAPIRFTAHNEFVIEKYENAQRVNLKNKWFDVELQMKIFMDLTKKKKYLGETFPVFWPNLGPNVYAAFYGCELIFTETTSWAKTIINDWKDLDKLKFDKNNEYFRKTKELTKVATEICKGNFMVGYTDLHPGLDCVAAWRGEQQLCFDLYDKPDKVKIAITKATNDFQMIFNHFDSMLKKEKQLSVSWMEIPSFGKMHIPSCDFTAMVSQRQFNEFYLPQLLSEVKHMTHNIFHLDGKDMAKHLDSICEIPEINAIQWVQGVGDDKPIMQWTSLIKKIQNKGKSVIVELKTDELEEFISDIDPHGIFLCIPVNEEDTQKQILNRLKKWI